MIIGLGEIKTIMGNPERYSMPSRCCVVEFYEHFHDRPILWNAVKGSRSFGAVDMSSPLRGFAGGLLPADLTEKQWASLISEAADRKAEPPMKMQWGIEVDQIIDREDLHDTYGGPPHETVSPSGSKPHVFIFSGGPDSRVFDVGDDDGSLVVEVSERRAQAVVHHLREGRALRVFRRVDGDRRKVRYCGQYSVVSDNPVVDVIQVGEQAYANIDTTTTRPISYLAVKIKPIGHAISVSADSANVGQPYRVTDEDISVNEGVPSVQDAVKHTAATRAHRRLQNQLAELFLQNKIEVRSPTQFDADFDLMAQSGSNLVVIEVKSIDNRNDNRNAVEQARKGFSQVCHYAEHYILRGFDVIPVLYLEQRPPSILESMASRRGVHVAWPESVSELLKLCR